MSSALTVSASVLALATLTGTALTQESTTIKLSSPFTESHFLWTQGGKVFADAVSEATQGKVKFEAYHANQLGKDQIGILTSGLAQCPSSDKLRLWAA